MEEAKDPEKFRDAIREVLRGGGTAEHLIAPPAEEASQDLVAVVPPLISYLGQGGPRYRAHVIDESRHPLAYGICIAGDRGLLITRGDGGRTVAVRTNDPDDVAALRDLLRPYWENKEPIIEDAGRRTRETVAGHSPEPSVALPFERLLTAVEGEEGPRRLFKEGLSILNIPVAIHAWKWRAAELCTAGWIPPDLLEVLHAQAWHLAAHGLRQLPPAVLDKYPAGPGSVSAPSPRGVRARPADPACRLGRPAHPSPVLGCLPEIRADPVHLQRELPPDEIPPACTYAAERGDIETIITRLIARLRSSRNYHLALIDDPAHSRNGSTSGSRRTTCSPRSSTARQVRNARTRQPVPATTCSTSTSTMPLSRRRSQAGSTSTCSRQPSTRLGKTTAALPAGLKQNSRRPGPPADAYPRAGAGLASAAALRPELQGIAAYETRRNTAAG